MIWPFPKVIDGSSCRCNCHNTATEYHPQGVKNNDPVHALTACSKCARYHRLAFIPRKVKPKNPDPFESGEEGG